SLFEAGDGVIKVTLFLANQAEVEVGLRESGHLLHNRGETRGGRVEVALLHGLRGVGEGGGLGGRLGKGRRDIKAKCEEQRASLKSSGTGLYMRARGRESFGHHVSLHLP